MSWTRLSFLFFLFGSALAGDATTRLYYTSAAADFNSALPVGNGRIGGLVYGTPTERIKLNENSFWSGNFVDRVNPAALDAWPEVRQQLLNGQLTEGNNHALQDMIAIPDSPKSYQPLVDLTLDLGHANSSREGFERWLDTTTGVTGSSYAVNGDTFSLETFASYPAEILVARINTTAENGMSLTIGLNRTENVYTQETSTNGTNSILLTGGSNESQDDGMYFASEVRVSASGGQVTASGKTISVSGATSVNIYFDAETSYRDDSMSAAQAEVARKLDNAEAMSFDDIRSEAIEDHSNLMDRVSLDLGNSSADVSTVPTNERLTDFQSDPDSDPELLTLVFNYGRHLLIASSRDTGPKSLAGNLQGIWNQDYDPAWGCKYTININIEMNYWPALVTNLAETYEGLVSLIETAQTRGQAVAQEMYGLDGFVLHHNLDLWGDAAPTDNGTSWAIWPLGGPWMVTHLMEYYRYTGNATFLRERAWPIMLDAAAFFHDYAFKNNENYLTGPSLSPENDYVVPANESVAGDDLGIDIAPTMDGELLWQLMGDIVEAGDVLGESENEDVSRAADYRAHIRPPQIGSYGQILEWRQEYNESDPGHRHLSPLWGLFPGHQMTPLVSSELAAAAKVLLDRRLDNGGGSTGWSRTWAANCYARLLDGDAAWKHAQVEVQQFMLPNLWNSNDGPPFQIDGNFGFVSAVAEMLLQSHAGNVHILPALPSQVAAGSVKGLVARGGFVVDMSWAEGQLVEATVLSNLGSDLNLRVAGGESFTVNGQAVNDTVATEAGKSYTVKIA